MLRKRTVLLEEMLWYDKSMGSCKEGRGGGQKKVTKSDVGRGVAAKKVIPLT